MINARVYLKKVNNLQKFLESRQKTPQGKLTVLVLKTLAKKLILKHLSDLINKYPLIESELIFSEQNGDLAKSNINIIVGFPQIPLITDNLKYRKMQLISNILCTTT
ncbi:hypothetical protein A2G94_06670 [Francisella endosymbiont of Ornithodoros moubata]|uniref:hypothetical protein n=1 Tax=Francisella-like endosymbiont TaxID=512373 RepID=UPI000A231A9B|nr:hypothetical protein A2G94_06670 [Francisella endosymbiont of Ornithodoros moubata]